MKRTIRRVIAVILCLCLVGSTGITLAFAAQTDDSGNDFGSVGEFISSVGSSDNLLTLKKLIAKIVNFLSNLIINGIVGRILNLATPTSRGVRDYQSFDLDSYGNFYPGMSEFLDAPAAGAAWSVGFGEASVMPADFGEKEYAKGAYLPYIYGNEMYKDDDGESEEFRARAVALDDGSGRGTVVFCAVDGMGLANADVRKIRAELADFAKANNIVSVNVDCTHIHTGIDSQGVWTDPVGSMLANSFTEEGKAAVAEGFLQAVIKGCYEAVTAAYADKKPGSMYFAKTDISEYLWDRTAPIAYDEYMYRLVFEPDDAAAKPTVICSFGCHPESSSYDWDKRDEDGKLAFDRLFSADFIWYMEKLANLAGFNFIYIQGNVSTTTSGRSLSNDGLDTDAHSTAMRYGYEMGYICLTMTMTEAERIAFNAETGDRLGVEDNAGSEDYTVWYEGRPTEDEEEVKPYINVASKQFFVQIDNNVVGTLGKTGMADNLVLRDNALNYYTVTEVGYMELGDSLKVYISPGETFTELLKGGPGLDGFEYECIRDRAGENTIIFDLCNDAAGYVANDVNFTLVGLQYNDETGSYDGDTWCLISYGSHAASAFIYHFYSLLDKFGR